MFGAVVVCSRERLASYHKLLLILWCVVEYGGFYTFTLIIPLLFLIFNGFRLMFARLVKLIAPGSNFN